MKRLRTALLIVSIALLLLAVACGGSQPSAGEPSVGPTAPAQSPTQPPAAPTVRVQSPSTGSGATQKVISLSASNRPGSSIVGTIAGQVVVGREYDARKPEILQLDWTVPVDARKIYFGFAVKNGPQRLVFTQTLILNGEPIKSLDPITLPASPPGKKPFSARGLAIKGGKQFPVGQYRIEVYSEGKLLQRAVFDVKQPVSTSALTVGRGMVDGYRDAYGGAQQVDPDIFEVTDEPIVEVDEEFVYYDEEDLNQAYADQENVEKAYEPFPEDVQLAIEEEADQADAAECGDVGGTYDPTTDTCAVDDPAEACLALGGIYDEGVCNFSPFEEILPEEPTTDPIADCEASGGVWDFDAQACLEPTPEGG